MPTADGFIQEHAAKMSDENNGKTDPSDKLCERMKNQGNAAAFKAMMNRTDEEIGQSYRPGLTETKVWERGDPIPVEVLKVGSVAFDSPEIYLEWMYARIPALGDRRPIDIVAEGEHGVALVCQTLLKIRDGEFS